MALDPVTLTRIREWTGSLPSDASIEATFGLQSPQSVEACALSILRTRRADLLSNPATFSVSGDYSQSTAKNLDMLDVQISQLEKATGTGPDVVTAGVLVRPTSSRRIRTRVTGW